MNYITFLFYFIFCTFIISCENTKKEVSSTNSNKYLTDFFSETERNLAFDIISYENQILTKDTIEITAKFYEKLNDLKNSKKLEADYFPILNSYSENNKSLLFISMADNSIVKIKIDPGDNLNEFDRFFTLIQENTLKLKKYYNSWNENIFYKPLNKEDITVAINLEKINTVLKKFNNNYLIKYIYSHYYIGVNFYNFYDIDKKNLTIQLHKIVDNENNDLSIFINKLDLYLADNLSNYKNFYSNFLKIFSTNFNSLEERYTVQSNYDFEKQLIGIRNLVLSSNENLNLFSSVNKLLENVKNIKMTYKLDNIYTGNPESDSIFHAEKINNFIASYENIGKNNEYYKYIEFSDAIFHYNNLAHSNKINNENEILYTAVTVPIKQIDLRDGNIMKVEFGDNFLYETENWKEYGGIFYNTPKLIQTAYATSDKEKSFSLIKALNLSHKKELPYYPNEPILLPITPEAYISYSYDNIPGILYNENKKLEIIRNIQKSNKFKFMYEFYDWRFYQFAIKNLEYEYIPTEIEIQLGKDKYLLMTPSISSTFENKLNYKFYGNGGSYYLKISSKAEYQIESSNADKWIIDASEVFGEVFLFGNIMAIGKKIITFNISEKPAEIVVIQSNGIIKNVNFSSRKNHISLVDYEKLLKSDALNSLKKMTEYSNQYEGYIELENYKSANNKAWYDIANNKIINPIYNSKNHLIIVGTNNNVIYFYNTKSKDILYMKIESLEKELENTLLLIEKNIASFLFTEEKLFIKNSENIIITMTHPNNIKIISYDNSITDIENLKIFAKNKNFILAERLMVFNAKNKLIGWYLSQKNEFFAKDISTKK